MIITDGDYLQGWTDQGALERAMATCTGPNGANDPGCSIGHPVDQKELNPETPAPTEEVGFNGKLDKLPGNNPVYYTSAKLRV